jgi:glycosyltransferase involved in cell wall biosynthesis
MRVCMITPHLPPEQAANALLPIVLGDELKQYGVSARYVSHPFSRDDVRVTDRRVDYVPRRGRDAWSRSTAGSLYSVVRMATGMASAVHDSDIVHLHGNGLIIEVGQLLARLFRKPYIVTLYGTDVWDFDARRHARFARVVRDAAGRVFYSRGLLEFARPLGLTPDPSTVVYAPVTPAFRPMTADQRRVVRDGLDVGDGPLIVTVKRLHPVAGYETLLQAIPQILSDHPDATFALIGEGELRGSLEAHARDAGVSARVKFLGRIDHQSISQYYAAADVFVLPSNVESWGTVMLEALASGTPVVATDTPGGVEVREHFGEDVTIVEKRDSVALAAAVRAVLRSRRGTSGATAERLRTEFTVARCAARYLDVYRRAVGER